MVYMLCVQFSTVGPFFALFYKEVVYFSNAGKIKTGTSNDALGNWEAFRTHLNFSKQTANRHLSIALQHSKEALKRTPIISHITRFFLPYFVSFTLNNPISIRNCACVLFQLQIFLLW